MLVNSALYAMGFREIPDNSSDYDTFLPCPLGTFSNSSSRGADGCTECPPGMLDFLGLLNPQMLTAVLPQESRPLAEKFISPNRALY